MALFNRRELKSKNFAQKLFNSNPKANFLIELENLLSDYENSLDSLSSSNVNPIAQKYSVDLAKDFVEERKAFLLRFAEKCLDDGRIDESEKKRVWHLASVLQLDDETAKDVYRQAVKETMDSYTKPIFESQVYSPDDESRMYAAAKNLGLNLTFPPEIQNKLVQYRQNWEIMNGKLPVLNTNMHLQAGEVLHHVQEAALYEERTETRRVNYGGFTYSQKIIGNLRWRMGTIAPQRITQDVWKQIDCGQVFLTSKRIIFSGQHGNKVIPYSKVLHFEAYSNGVQIQKDSGKSPFFEFSDGVPMFAEILNRLIGQN